MQDIDTTETPPQDDRDRQIALLSAQVSDYQKSVDGLNISIKVLSDRWIEECSKSVNLEVELKKLQAGV